MNEEWVKRQTATPESRRLYEQERLVVWATDTICEFMEQQGKTKAELAAKLGTSRAYVTQLLRGSRNMTLRTLADLAWALDQRVTIVLEPLRDGRFISSPVQIVGSVRPRVVAAEEVPAAGREPAELNPLAA